MIKNKALYFSFVLFLGLVLIGLWISFIDMGDLKSRIMELNPQLLALSALVYLSAYFVRSFRWNLLLRPVIKLSLLQSWLFSLGGNFANYLIPIRLGELVKAWFVKKRHGISMVRTLPSVFIDKSFDTLGIFIVLSILPFISIQLGKAMLILLAVLVLVFIITLAIVLGAAVHKETSIKVLSLISKLFPNKIGEKINHYINLFICGLNIFDHHWSMLLYALLLTALGALLDGLYFYLVFRAFGSSIAFLLVLFGYTLINLSYALPQPPAQLGSNEWMMIIIFSVGFGLTVQGVSVIMATAHVLTAMLISIGGVIAFSYSGTNVLRMIIKGEDLYEQ